MSPSLSSPFHEKENTHCITTSALSLEMSKEIYFQFFSLKTSKWEKCNKTTLRCKSFCRSFFRSLFSISVSDVSWRQETSSSWWWRYSSSHLGRRSQPLTVGFAVLATISKTLPRKLCCRRNILLLFTFLPSLRVCVLLCSLFFTTFHSLCYQCDIEDTHTNFAFHSTFLSKRSSFRLESSSQSLSVIRVFSHSVSGIRWRR